jgi:8-oxo-dGTP pyrophosphatase MutT (NUDIX family)
VAAIIEQNGRFLMVEENDDGQAVVNQPAGHLEAGETLLQAVSREVLEETAHPFQPTALTGVYRWVHPEKDLTFLRFCFCGDIGPRDAQRALDPDIVQTHWLSRDEIAQRPQRSPLVLTVLDDYLRGQRFPLDLYRDLSP